MDLGSMWQVPMRHGRFEAVWNASLAQHFYTWPALLTNLGHVCFESNTLYTEPHAFKKGLLFGLLFHKWLEAVMSFFPTVIASLPVHLVRPWEHLSKVTVITGHFLPMTSVTATNHVILSSPVLSGEYDTVISIDIVTRDICYWGCYIWHGYRV